MNKKLDHDQVVLMAKTGLHPTLIADRLDCSRRQVDRILKRKQIPTPTTFKSLEDEHFYWELFDSMGETHSRIARRFGVSRQAVNKHFNSKLTRLAS